MTARYLKPREVAEIRRMSVSSLAQERYHGEGPPYVKDGARVLYPEDLLDEWLRARLVTPTRPARPAIRSVS
ncbi:MAG TPA: helix-turn-helix domain-containing protein [Jatrophihabitantaceae bacterium]|jgi:hypothetical protein